MSITDEILRLQRAKQALKDEINGLSGLSLVEDELIDAYPAKLDGLPLPTELPIGATTVRQDASHTTNIASNDHIRIRDNYGVAYTLAEWNALFVEAGYDISNMGIEPVGIRVQAADVDEVYLFDRYTGVTYNPSGETAGAAGKLQHSLYNHTLVVAAGSGTDSTTGKAWSVTDGGNTFILSEANTGQSWEIAKNTGGVFRHKANNIEARVNSLWAQNEWMRHRMAIDSGVATSWEDGEIGEVRILNASGNQPAVGEDMYFWVGNDSEGWTNTGKLAKYNLNNRHNVSGYSLTQAIADAIYAKQKANGINMNDTGVNSATKPILAPGSKGAESIAVGGKWYIITPYISNPNATTATVSSNLADSPAIYWAIEKGCVLPSDGLLDVMYFNKTLCDAIINYLNSVEGRGIPTIPTGDYIWSAVRTSAVYCWSVYLYVGYVGYGSSSYRYYVVGASAS